MLLHYPSGAFVRKGICWTLVVFQCRAVEIGYKYQILPHHHHQFFSVVFSFCQWFQQVYGPKTWKRQEEHVSSNPVWVQIKKISFVPDFESHREEAHVSK